LKAAALHGAAAGAERAERKALEDNRRAEDMADGVDGRVRAGMEEECTRRRSGGVRWEKSRGKKREASTLHLLHELIMPESMGHRRHPQRKQQRAALAYD